MNLQELIIELYEQMGEPSDLDPYDDTDTFDISTDGAVRAIRILNNGQTAIAMWRFPSGTIHRVRELEDTVFFKTRVVSGTAQGGGSDTITLASGSGSVVDQYKSWIVRITGGTGEGQTRLIISFDESSQQCEVNEDWDVVPDATSEYELYKALYQFVDPSSPVADQNIPVSPYNEILAMMSLTDVKNRHRLHPVERTNTFSSLVLTYGTPSAFYEMNGGIKFDVAADNKRTYAIDYVKQPKELSASDDVPEMPEQYHLAIVMWGVWWYYRMKQESGAAYAAKRDLDDFMGRIQSQDSRRWDRAEGHITIKGVGEY